MIVLSILCIVMANYCLMDFFKSNDVLNLRMIFMERNIYTNLFATLVVLAILSSLYTLVMVSFKKQQFQYLIGFIPIFVIACFAIIYLGAITDSASMSLFFKQMYGLNLIIVCVLNTVGLALYIKDKRLKAE